MKKKDSMPLFRIRLSHLMHSLGLSQARFADLIGVTPAALSMILDGKRLPSLITFDKICHQTGASADYLLGIKLGANQ